MRIGVAQIDTRVADLAGNAARIVAATRAADALGAEVVVFPEQTVPGYPCRDLFYDRRFVDAIFAATAKLARDLDGAPPVIAGTIAMAKPPRPGYPGLFNVAALIHGGKVIETRAKSLLPAYDVFHETRWFVPADSRRTITIGRRRIGLLICEDLWSEGYDADPAAELLAEGAELLVCISASPFRKGVHARRLEVARRPGAPIVVVNAIGAQDELIFDGSSFALDARGDVVASLARFEEDVAIVDVEGPRVDPPALGAGEEIVRALVLGVRDFSRKNGVRKAVLGLSGGVDSAVVACIAKEALGAENVTGVAIPSRHTDERSTLEARNLARALGIAFEVIELEPLHAAAEAVAASIGGATSESDTTIENVQARLRAMILMAVVNRRGGILLNTSNKTELSLGYGTLYGDLAGTLSVIGDLTKTDVYAVARLLGDSIPRFIVERAPSAELKPDQVDPFDYDRVAPLVESIVQGEPVEGGRYEAMIRGSEHKRWQSGIVLKVTERAFGSGRMMPVTRGG